MALHSISTGAGYEVLQETAQAEVVVSGSVTGPAGTPVAGLAVELRNSNGGLVNRRYTDSNGSYQVTSHPTGAATGADVPDIFTLGAIYPNPTGGQSVLPVTIAGGEDDKRQRDSCLPWQFQPDVLQFQPCSCHGTAYDHAGFGKIPRS